MIRPEDILVVGDAPERDVNVFDATVGLSIHTGDRNTCELLVGDRPISAELHGRHVLKQGNRVKVGVRIDHVRAFARSAIGAKQPVAPATA